MEIRNYTAESVTKGHPDKLADLIADSILDECLSQDANSRVAVEVMLTGKNVFIVGEITSLADVKYDEIAKQVIADVGYETKDLEIMVKVHKQSEDINQAVSKDDQGAGDQGIMYGYATEETLNFMPLAIDLAHRLTDRLTYVREQGILDYLLPDGKSQVTVQYKNGSFDGVKNVTISTQHKDGISMDNLREDIIDCVIGPVFANFDFNCTMEVLVNPSGRFVLGGFEADSGLTGRKLMVDSYGGIAHHGGGAFSGKDPSKIDRSGAYMARYIAKNIVGAGLAEQCEVAISYAIGQAEPTSLDVNTFYTGAVSDEMLKDAVLKTFDFRPKAIIEKLDLLQPVYSQTAVGGHFGKEYLMWEQLDKIDEIKKAILER